MDRHEEARIARADRIATEIARLRAAGGAARDLHTSKIEPLAERLAHELPDDFTPAVLAGRIEVLIQAHPLLMSAQTSGSVQKSPYNKREWRAMPAAERLEKINEQEHEAREAEAAAERKIGKADHTAEQLRAMTPSRRLEIANELSRFGADETPAPKPVTREQLARMTAQRRLHEVNRQAEESRKASRALGKRLSAVRKEAE